MKRIKTVSTLSVLGLAMVLAGCGSIREIGQINGKTIYKITTRDLLAPSTTSVVDEDLNPVNVAGGPGFVPAVATAGGLVGAAALLRPARSENNTSTNVRTSSQGGSGGVGGTGGNGGQGGSGQFVPPGHVNNPSENH